MLVCPSSLFILLTLQGVTGRLTCVVWHLFSLLSLTLVATALSLATLQEMPGLIVPDKVSTVIPMSMIGKLKQRQVTAQGD